jgi:uncharacterized protein YjbI with pentapeptide repeats
MANNWCDFANSDFDAKTDLEYSAPQCGCFDQSTGVALRQRVNRQGYEYKNCLKGTLIDFTQIDFTQIDFTQIDFTEIDLT